MKNGIIVLIVLVLLTGCKVKPVETIVEPVLIHPTNSVVSTLIPTENIPTVVTPTATTMPTNTPMPENIIIDLPEVIDIQYPFSSGKVPATGFTVQGMAEPTFEQNLIIRIVDMDGNEQVLLPTTIQAEMGTRGLFSEELELNARLDSSAMLQIFSRSAKDGSLEHLNSRILNFVSDFDEPENLYPLTEKIVITGLRVGQFNTRLELQAEGLAVGIFENTLEYKLCGDGGVGTSDFICGGADNVITAGIIQLEAPEMGQPGTFILRAEIPHGKWKTGRLVIYTTSAANGEIEHASSAIIKNGP